MSEKKYVNGVRFFPKKESQPDFVIGSIVLNPEQIAQWAKENPDLCSDYKGQQQIKLDVLRSKQGEVYTQLNTFKPKANEPERDLPF